MILKNDPWKHILLEDFLSFEDFKSLREIAKNEIKPLGNKKKIRLVKIYDTNGNELNTEDTNDGGQPLHYSGLFESYFEISKSILAYLDISKIADIKKINFEMQSIEPNFSYKVHCDRPDKLLSIVIYLDPDHNYGTFIHKSESDEGNEIKWDLNSGVAFSARYDHTWHSFKSNEKRRTTFNINLYDSIIKM